MKFGKRLKQQIDESLPEWRDKYLSYKKLKKLLKLISSAPPAANDSGKAEAEFMYLLNSEIEKFNAFFMEQEEDFVIRHKIDKMQELAQRIKKVMEKFGESEEGYKEHMNQIRKDSVDFHGEMVLLINYSNINYTGVAKILKKYEKRSGGVLRLPFIQKVVQQPFFRTELISKLAKEWEGTIESAFPPSDTATGSRPAVEGIFRNTVAALLTMQEMRRGSSTYTHFSLPPLHIPDFDHVLQSLHPLPLSPIQIP